MFLNICWKYHKIDIQRILYFPLLKISETKMLTKIKDVDLMIMERMDDESLLNFCISHKSNEKLCNNDMFWKKTLSI